MRILKGLAASPGIAFGKVFWISHPALLPEQRQITDPRTETERLEKALNQAKQELLVIAQLAETRVGREQADIFEAQSLFLDDPVLLDTVNKMVQEERLNVEFAWHTATQQYAQRLSQMENQYFAARAADVRDVGRRVLGILMNVPHRQASPTEPAIVVADDLSPTDTISFDRSKVLAICTESGGPTSHVAILSKSLGIPCVVGLGADIRLLTESMPIIVDGNSGEVIAEPDESTIAEKQVKAGLHLELQKQALAHAASTAQTRDGKFIEVAANIGSYEDAVKAVEFGADGVGLFRTEFLYLNRNNPPTEIEQTRLYQKIFQTLGSERPIVVRTLDIGGDKPAPYLDLPPEDNPFLGLRGLRLCLHHLDLFESQLRALLIAGSNHNLRIMFPMVSSYEEVILAIKHLRRIQNDLTRQGVPIADKVQIGIMIEVPSAALTANNLAAQVDFFSIGTNDLAQYTLAADRTNARVARMADALHPSVLQLIHKVVSAAHRHGKWVGICGELAGDLTAVPVLLGLGLDEFSVSPPLIPGVKETIRRFSIEETEGIARRVVRMKNAQAVRDFLSKRMN